MEDNIDSRNKLNDLTGKEWLKLTKSFWLSEKCVDDKDAFKHPAPFLIKDIMKLISMFTKSEMRVLDPFCGSGTTLIAANNLQRIGIGIDLSEEYKSLAIERLNKKNYTENKDFFYRIGDANKVLKNLQAVDYIVTSPPYHNILRNKGEGLRKQSEKGFRNGSRIGVEYYSEHENDLGNKDSYKDFLTSFEQIMKKCFAILNAGKYTSIIISDFTVDKAEVCVQADIVKTMQNCGFEFVGTTVLLQDNKPLYPFGYPYAYKINHNHQNIINFRKPKE
ncbi:MAG: methyltransferase domain-containing protein [Dysgonamonadaceae bacterium]|jgi:DNA modification methylase|nr:methyltransferase domain-containing protein [Dysgonamonadaceae bacterium]